MLCAHALPALPVLDMPSASGTVLPLLALVSSAAHLALGWSPDPFGSGIAGANIPFLLLVAALVCLTVQTPFPALHALSGPWAVFFGSGLSAFGALRMWGSGAVPDPSQPGHTLGCQIPTEGAGDGSGELWDTQSRKGCVWLWGSLGKSCQGYLRE